MAHSFFKTTLLATLLISLTAPAAYSQNQYTYRMGNQRVQCGHGGLAAGGTSSYITGGTLSQSAQVGAGIASPYGAGAGMVGTSGLQKARMGSTVGVAGDYMRSDINPNISFQQQQQRRIMYPVHQQVSVPTLNYNQQHDPNATAYYNYSRASGTQMRQSTASAPIATHVQQQQSSQPAAATSTTAATGAATSAGGSASEFKGY